MFNWRGREACDGPVVLDEAYLKRLAGHMGDDTLRELMHDGLLELVDRMNTIDALLEASETETLGRTVHDIAGMAGHLGLSRLSTAAVDAERLLRDPSTAAKIATSVLRAEAPEAIAALRDFLDGAGAD